MPIRPITPNQNAEKKIATIVSATGAARYLEPQGGDEEGQTPIGRIVGGT